MNVTREARSPQSGPSLVVLGVASLGLLLAGIAISAAAGGVLPSPYADPGLVEGFFASHPASARASGVFAFASSVPLAIYAATVSTRLAQLGVSAPGARIALVGGVLAAASLAASGLLQTVLSRAAGGGSGIVLELHELSFLSGGPAHVVWLGLLVAGLAVPGLILGLLPRRLAQAGLALAALAQLCTVVLIWPQLVALVPVARFLALGWLILVGVMLPYRRPPGAPAPASATTTKRAS